MGLWSAFWMLPKPPNSEDCMACGKYGRWAASGEIDIFETYNLVEDVSALLPGAARTAAVLLCA